MQILAFLTLFCFILLSCKKQQDEAVKTFTGNLPIVATSSPATVVAGQEIRSNVCCQLSSISGSVSFQHFDIKETGPRQFSISAKALYKNWNTQIGLPVMWTLDTIASINTTTAGIYILKFYNASQLVKSDTVLVN